MAMGREGEVQGDLMMTWAETEALIVVISCKAA
jgi:hypothetical protein